MNTPKNKISKSQLSMWWFPLLVAGVIIGGTLLVLLPQFNQLQENRAKVKTVEAQLEKAQAKLDQINQLDLNDLNRLEDLAAKALPEHKPYFEALVTLQQLAAETEVFLQGFELDPGSLATESAKKVTKANQGYEMLSTELTISGTTEGVSQFVERLQRALPLITTKSISISQMKTEEVTEQRQARLGLDLFYVEQQPEKTKVSLEPLPKFTQSQQDVFVTLAEYSTIEASDSATSIPDFERTDIFTF